MSNAVRQFYEIVAERYAAVSRMPLVSEIFPREPLWCEGCQAETAQMRVYERGVVIKRVCVMCGCEARSEDHED